MGRRAVEKKMGRWLWMAIMALTTFLVGYCEELTSPIRWPDEGQPTLLYSTQLGDDLRRLYLDAFSRAEKSIFLCIYSFSDRQLAAELRRQKQKGISVVVICDREASPHISSLLGPDIPVHFRGDRGLMHLKIAIVDDQRLLIGSANLTTEGLTIQRNLVCAIQSRGLSHFLQNSLSQQLLSDNKKNQREEHLVIGGQQVEMWLLPNEAASSRLTQLIDSAKKSVKVAMFTFTRHDLGNALVRAHKRGVAVSVTLDRHQTQSANRSLANFLEKRGIPPYQNRSSPLFHYKVAEIDGEFLVCGSANWTKAAFSQNDDCFLLIHSLTEEQKARLHKLWRAIEEDRELIEAA